MWLAATSQPSACVPCPGTRVPGLTTWELEPEEPGLQAGKGWKRLTCDNTDDRGRSSTRPTGGAQQHSFLAGSPPAQRAEALPLPSSDVSTSPPHGVRGRSLAERSVPRCDSVGGSRTLRTCTWGHGNLVVS